MDVSTIWLREECGSRAYLPDATNTRFDFPTDVSRLPFGLIVEGSELQGQQPSTSGSTYVATPVAPRPLFTSGKKSHVPTVNVKVVQASMERLPSGKCEFSHMGQMCVDVTESTANVNYIRSVVQKRWGSDYSLVRADGLQIEDNSRTQGVP